MSDSIKQVAEVRGEGNSKPMAERVALERANKAAGGKPFVVLSKRFHNVHGPKWWCFLKIEF